MTFFIKINLFILIICFSGCVFNSHEIQLIKGLPVIEKSKKVDDEWLFDNECKVIIYFKIHQFEWGVKKYSEYIDKYPNTAFIFYLGGEGEEELRQKMSDSDFDYPIFWDKDKKFLTANHLEKKVNNSELSFIGYIVANSFIELTNPTVADFEFYLQKCNVH